MSNSENGKPYDLEERTFQFAKASRSFVKELPRTIAIEANETLGKKDFAMKIKICRREAKESGYWLRLIEAGDILAKQRDELVAESTRVNEDLRCYRAQIGRNLIQVISKRLDIVSDFDIRHSNL